MIIPGFSLARLSQDHIPQQLDLLQECEESVILATLRMSIPPQTRGQVSRTLKSMVRETLIEPGCLSSRLYRDENEEAVFMCEQVWRNQGDLNHYLRSEDYRHMLLIMELAGEPPEVKFQTISETAGIEVIEKARGATRNGDA